MILNELNIPITLVVKPVSSCNCQCVYCSAGSNKLSSIEKEDWLDIFLLRLKEECERVGSVNIVWHGFEPLMAGKRFFRRVLSFLNDNNLKNNTHHVLQSNLILYDSEYHSIFSQLLDKNGYGLSSDPIPKIRPLVLGQDSWPFFVDKFLYLKSKNSTASALYVVHKKALNKAKQLYWCYRNLGFSSIRFNPIYGEGHAKFLSQDGLLINYSEYDSFIDSIIELWNGSDKQFPIFPINDWINIKKKHNCNSPCAYSESCGISQLGIDENLFAYPCGRFSDGNALSLGNLRELSIYELRKNLLKTGLYMRREILRNTLCRDCESWEYCKGGCADDARLQNNDIFEKTIWCPVFQNIHEKIRRINIE